MRLREIARIPFDDDAIEAGLVGISEKQALLLPAFLACPLDVLGQDGGNMGWIGYWAHGVVDRCLGALRLSDPGKNGGADNRGEGNTQDRRSAETHARLLRVTGNGGRRARRHCPVTPDPHDAPIMTPDDVVSNRHLAEREIRPTLQLARSAPEPIPS